MELKVRTLNRLLNRSRGSSPSLREEILPWIGPWSFLKKASRLAASAVQNWKKQSAKSKR